MMMMNFSTREAFSSCCSQQKLRLHYTEKRKFTKMLFSKRERERESERVSVRYVNNCAFFVVRTLLSSRLEKKDYPK